MRTAKIAHTAAMTPLIQVTGRAFIHLTVGGHMSACHRIAVIAASTLGEHAVYFGKPVRQARSSLLLYHTVL